MLPDGSYAGTWTITQPLPPGPSDVEVWCTDPESGGDGDIGTARTTATGTPPALPGLTGEAGAVVPITYPCSGDGAGVSVRIRTLFTQMPYLEPIDGHLGTVGETMHIELPADLAPGPYDLAVGCISDNGTFEHYTSTLVVTAPGGAAPAAVPAVPQSGSSAYTG